MVLSRVGDIWESPCFYSPLPFPGAHLPVPPPSAQVLQRPLEDGGCDPEEPERRWVRYHPAWGGFGDPHPGPPALNPPAFPRRALRGAAGSPELETQDL